jgi:hypothetical protein
VYVCEGENEGGQVKLKDLNGRGVELSKNGRIWIGHWNKGKINGVIRWISMDGSQ